MRASNCYIPHTHILDAHNTFYFIYMRYFSTEIEMPCDAKTYFIFTYSYFSNSFNIWNLKDYHQGGGSLSLLVSFWGNEFPHLIKMSDVGWYFSPSSRFPISAISIYCQHYHFSWISAPLHIIINKSIHSIMNIKSRIHFISPVWYCVGSYSCQR